MSVWGKGPFQDDTSLDFRGELVDYLIDRIEGALESKFRSVLSLYVVHSASAILHLVTRNFGGSVERTRVDKWRKATEEIVTNARASGSLEPIDSELIETLTQVYLRLYELP